METSEITEAAAVSPSTALQTDPWLDFVRYHLAEMELEATACRCLVSMDANPDLLYQRPFQGLPQDFFLAQEASQRNRENTSNLLSHYIHNRTLRRVCRYFDFHQRKFETNECKNSKELCDIACKQAEKEAVFTLLEEKGRETDSASYKLALEINKLESDVLSTGFDDEPELNAEFIEAYSEAKQKALGNLEALLQAFTHGTLLPAPNGDHLQDTLCVADKRTERTVQILSPDCNKVSTWHPALAKELQSEIYGQNQDCTLN